MILFKEIKVKILGPFIEIKTSFILDWRIYSDTPDRLTYCDS